MERIKVSYEVEDDILFIRRQGVRPRGSVEIGDFVIDFTSEMNRAVGLEIMNASRILTKSLGVPVRKSDLSSIKRAVLRTEHRGDVIYICYGLLWSGRKAMEQSMIPVVQTVSC